MFIFRLPTQPRTPMLALIFSCLLLLSPASLADISADQAAAIAVNQYGGKVVKLQVVTVDGHKAYRIKLLQDSGRLRVLLLDAETGAPVNLKAN